MTITIEVDETTLAALAAAQERLGTTDQSSTVAAALAQVMALEPDPREAALARELSPERTAAYATLDRKKMW